MKNLLDVDSCPPLKSGWPRGEDYKGEKRLPSTLTNSGREIERRSEGKEKETLVNTTNISGDSTQAIQPVQENKMSVVSAEILQEELNQQSGSLNEAISVTMNLIDSSAKELLGQMKDSARLSQKNEFQKTTLETVQTSALAARSIAELLKVKVETIKLLKD